jgi:hypothetical protein
MCCSLCDVMVTEVMGSLLVYMSHRRLKPSCLCCGRLVQTSLRFIFSLSTLWISVQLSHILEMMMGKCVVPQRELLSRCFHHFVHEIFLLFSEGCVILIYSK